jgi:hypothetical protein
MSQTTFIPDAPRDTRTLASGAPEAGGVIVDATRPRQTERPGAPFRDFLAGGVSVLMGGAAVATHVMGAPRLAAAISGAESRATTAIAGAPALVNRDFVSSSSIPASTATGGAANLPASGATLVAAAAGTGSEGSDLAQMQAMQRESQVFNMQLLALQDQVQQDSQRFTTLSNVMRAKHDTAKAAVSNIRS